ncbi:MAG TPA: alpha/beta fold hydrolase [Euzebyales bacterium]|nr:alpha/beta fold hydrolase [Euzebyales bacterium]
MLVGAVAFAGVVAAAAVWLRQDALIYFPSDTVPSAADVGLPEAEPLTVRTTDELDLDAWYVPAEGDPVGAVLVLHGNAGDRADRAPLAIALRERGLASLLLDYRGFGGNPGTPSQQGLLNDAEAAAVALERHSGLDRDRLVYFGESLGSAPAAWLASRRPPAAVVLRSPFPNLTEIGRRRFPWLPVEWLLRDQYPLASWIVDYEGPLLVIAGERDRLILVSDSQRVVNAAGGAARLLVVPDAGHNDLELLAGATVLDGITAFLRDDAGLPVRDAPAS